MRPATLRPRGSLLAMSGCCLRRIDGVAPGGGGDVVAAGWTCVYEIDWREAFADLGAVDLNSPGNTLTFQGVQWATPSVANSGINQASSATSWALSANGLEMVGGVFGSISSAGPSFPHIFANLADIAANTAMPFDGDPTRKYLLQVFVSSTNAAAANEESGIGLYAIAGAPTGTGDGFMFVSIGSFGGVNNSPSGVADINPGTPTRFSRTDLGGAPPAVLFDAPTLHYAGSGNTMDAYAASFDDTGAWPDNDTFRAIGGTSPGTDFNAAMPQDPVEGWRVAIGHNGTFDGVIQQTRICQL